jgi:hypothetical protein
VALRKRRRLLIAVVVPEGGTQAADLDERNGAPAKQPAGGSQHALNH